MRTFLYLSASALVVGFAYWAYQVNYDTQEAVRRVDQLRQDIAAEREALSVLHAEWAYLNRPDRLRMLAEINFPDLGLMPMAAEHFGDPGMVPYPMPDIDDLVASALETAADDQGEEQAP